MKSRLLRKLQRSVHQQAEQKRTERHIARSRKNRFPHRKYRRCSICSLHTEDIGLSYGEWCCAECVTIAKSGELVRIAYLSLRERRYDRELYHQQVEERRQRQLEEQLKKERARTDRQLERQLEREERREKKARLKELQKMLDRGRLILRSGRSAAASKEGTAHYAPQEGPHAPQRGRGRGNTTPADRGRHRPPH